MAFTLAQILEWTGGRLANSDALGSSPDVKVERPAAELGCSRRNEVAFFFSKEYQDQVPAADPGILVTGEPFIEPLRQSGLPIWSKAAIVACADPYRSLAVLSRHFASRLSHSAHFAGEHRGESFIHPTAVVHESARVGEGVRVGPHCVVERDAQIGSGAILYSGCYVGPESVIGDDSVLFPNVVIYERVIIGARARLHAGVVIGADGFGFAPVVEGGNQTGHEKIFHLGRVVIGDDVEIGANSCVDRGTFGDTILGSQVKIDNQVQVGHNARVEEGGVICGGAALAGHAHVGRFAYIGGLTGVTNKVHVGNGAKVGAVSLVTKDVPPGETAVGNPQREYREHFKAHAALNKLISRRRAGVRTAGSDG